MTHSTGSVLKVQRDRTRLPAGKPFPVVTLGHRRTHEIEELRAAAPASWVEEWHQLGYGKFSGELLYCCTSALLLGRAKFAPGLYSRGPRTADTVTLYICFQNRGPACLRGRQMRPEELVVLFPDEETDFRTACPFDVFVLAVERTRLEQHAAAVLGCPVSAMRRNERLAVRDLSELRRGADALLSAMVRAPQQHAALLRDAEGARTFETRVIDCILSAVQAPRTEVPAPVRRRLAWHAQEYLHSNLNAQLTVRALCQATGATERTLHRAFQEQFGTTPKAYLKMLRLNAVRDELRRAAGQRVTEVALRWGFLHPGWFARDYAAMFGELPSQTAGVARRHP